MHFNPRALTGRDRLVLVGHPRAHHFNPRAPYGARHPGSLTQGNTNEISIHAPLTGRDPAPQRLIDGGFLFQSTRPLRGATGSPAERRTSLIVFQSTRPLRGATRAEDKFCSTSEISIHAPLTGRDQGFPPPGHRPKRFQSTRPLRGATILRFAQIFPCPYFNPRAPYGARRSSRHRPASRWRFQSTRPLRGATSGWWTAAEKAQNFNPRAPYGARHCLTIRCSAPAEFQSTRPLRGATGAVGLTTPEFQSTRPLRGATAVRVPYLPGWQNFNPRAPYGARLPCIDLILSPVGFQSTRPLRGATLIPPARK